MTPSRLFNTLILVLLATSPVAAQEGRPRLSGPPPLSLDSVPSVLPPAEAPAGASAWSGIWSGGFSWKVEGDSNSAEVLLQLNADGTYGLAYSEHFLYQSFAGGHWRPTPEGILLDAPLAGKHRPPERCALEATPADELTGLSACMHWLGLDGNPAELLLRRQRQP